MLGSVVYLARQLRRRGPLVQSLVASAPHSWGVRLHPVWYGLLVATPLAKGLFHKAIGESGAFFSVNEGAMPLAAAEQQGVKFGDFAQAPSLAALRGKPAQEVMEAAGACGADIHAGAHAHSIKTI